jgi:Family of unknown function (DUF6232)
MIIGCMSRLRWQPTLPKVLVSPPWRSTGRPVRVTLDKRVLRVGSDIYPVAAMSAVHVDTLEDGERWQARRQLVRTNIYGALPLAGLGIVFLRAGWTYVLVGGLLLGVAVLVLGIGTGRYINHVRRPALYRLVAVMAGQRRTLFSCRDHEAVWAVHNGLVRAMNTAATGGTTMTFTINGGQGFQFGNGNTQYNNF